jgi:hypothetical protein
MTTTNTPSVRDDLVFFNSRVHGSNLDCNFYFYFYFEVKQRTIAFDTE